MSHETSTLPSVPSPATPAGLDPSALESMPIPRLIEELCAGDLDAGTISPSLRAACVEHLTNEGRTIEEIAQMIRVSPRTIGRDRQAARRERAIGPGLTLGDELLGEFERYTQSSLARLTRMARDNATPPSVRLWAEESASRIYHRFIDAARKLEYIETGAKRLKFARETGPEYERRRLTHTISAYRSNGNQPPDDLLKALKALDRAEKEKAH